MKWGGGFSVSSSLVRKWWGRKEKTQRGRGGGKASCMQRIATAAAVGWRCRCTIMPRRAMASVRTQATGKPGSSSFFTAEQKTRFQEDGFLVIDRLIDPSLAEALKNRFPFLFR